jgi:L-lactate dehydrogenase (cytochrome)
VMIDLSQLSVATTVLGEPWTLPVAIAPTGLTGLFHGNGEIHGARAAEKVGVPFTLSTMSICSIEDVRAAVTKPFWFQLYMMRDRSFTEELISRAVAARCSALMLTLDLTVQGVRRRDVKNGLSIPPRLTLKNALDIATKPAWAMGVLFGKRRTFGNLEARLKNTGGLLTLSQWIATQFDPSITWKEIEWVRARWPGKLIVKGVLDAEDGRLAAEHGVDALVVSNHGGRQLDSAPSSISVLPEVVDAVAGRCEVLFDGGVQTGQDVLKALARGARACLIGKSFLYALAAGGEAGVCQALDILRRELEVSMALSGCTDVTQVDARVLRHSRPQP